MLHVRHIYQHLPNINHPVHVGKHTNGVYGFIWVWHVSSSLCKWSYSSRFATSTARTQRISQLGRPCPRVEPMWSSTWAEIAPKRIQLPSCAMIGPKLEPSGSKLGRSWACYWPKVDPSGAHVAAMSDRNGAFGRCWADLQNVQTTSPVHFLARRRSWKWTAPAEAAPVNRELFESIGSAPKLSRLGTFGAGGFISIM